MRARHIKISRYLALASLIAFNGYDFYLASQPACLTSAPASFITCASPMQWQAYLDGIATGADLTTALGMMLFTPAPIRRALRRMLSA